VLHSKINYYLPKYKTSILDFTNIMQNIFINDMINNEEIIRYDYKTRALQYLIYLFTHLLIIK
jgi:hypothetical protein